MLEVSGLNIKYNNKDVVSDINFKANDGEICVFLGFTGCGKTSIFNSIVNLIEYDGTILFNNKKIVNKDLKIAVSTQHYNLFNFKTVYENIALGFKLRKEKVDRDLIIKLLSHFSLEEHIDKYPDKLSGGQKQIVSLIRSVIVNPELFLLDEPFSALDSFSREYAQNFLLDYIEGKKTTTLLITHSIEEALFLGDKIIVLGDKPTKVVKVIENKRGITIKDDDFKNKVLEIRNLFGLK